MKAGTIHPVILTAAAAIAGCASQAPNTSPQSTGATAATESVEPAATAETPPDADGKKHELAGLSSTLEKLNRTRSSGDGYRRVVRDGKVRYCYVGTLTGSKLYKTRCLNENEYAEHKKRQEDYIRRMGSQPLCANASGDSNAAQQIQCGPPAAPP